MSPEQSLGMPVDARSDLYAAGAVLFQLVAGRPPFTGKSPIDVLMQQTDKPPPKPSAFTPGLDAGLERVILRALAKLPENRFQSAVELSEALATILPELSAGLRRESVRPPSSSLPGVPSVVAITSDVGPRVSPIPAERPPDTLRSPVGEVAAEALLDPPPPSSKEPSVLHRAEILATALAEAGARPANAPPTPAAPEAAAEATTPPPIQVVPAQVSARITKAEAFLSTLAEGAVLPMAETPAPAPPPPAPAPIVVAGGSPGKPGSVPGPPGPAGAGHAAVPPWVFVVVTTVLVAILVLVRYLRFR
jgi:serine/threonine-protein kinase